VQRAAPPATPRNSPPTGGSSALKGICVLAVDNDPDALDAMRQLLLSWGCDVIAAGNADAIGPSAHDAALWLFDYHLDDGDTGVALWQRLVTEH
ncbi:hypothetical protein RA272_28520, partial [Pseudomonas syringae pv. tagetis]